jgi:transcriptional regulator with XRE-family HTH domain
MQSADLIVAGRRRAGLSQAQLAKRLGRTQSTIARWETGHQHPPLETVIEALHACDLELTVGLARFDDSYDAQIAAQLRLSPRERIERLAPPYVARGFDPLGLMSDLAGHARFVVIGTVAAALQGWPILLGGRSLEIVPADSSIVRVEQFAKRHGAESTDDQPEGSQRWILPSGGELRATPCPRGTRGYPDLARDAERMLIEPKTSIRAASVVDLIRIAESSLDPDARTFTAALWATLEMQHRKQQRAARS